jgi:histone H3/H4
VPVVVVTPPSETAGEKSSGSSTKNKKVNPDVVVGSKEGRKLIRRGRVYTDPAVTQKKKDAAAAAERERLEKLARKIRPKKKSKGGTETEESGSKGIRRPYRFKQKTRLERAVKKAQKETNMIFPRSPMYRIIVDILRESAGRIMLERDLRAAKLGKPATPGCGVRIRKEAVDAIMEAAQIFYLNVFEMSTKLLNYKKRATFDVETLQLTLELMKMKPKQKAIE